MEGSDKTDGVELPLGVELGVSDIVHVLRGVDYRQDVNASRYKIM